MSIAKPFTFVANTHAKSSEVNANFDTVYSQVNSNISAISQNAVDIENLENNKADINGNTAQRFAVADAITDSDAINKRTLRASIANSIDYISGFIITKDSGSPEDTIIVSEGSCYDSTKTVVLNKNNSSTKTNGSQAASATYYVYVIGNSTGSQIDILISTSSTAPALPSGYTLYRQIGNYTTNSSNNIDSISYYGVDALSNKSPNASINSIMPDYSKVVSISSGYTVAKFGYIFVYAHVRLGATSISINDVSFNVASSSKSETSAGSGILFPVSPGDYVTVSFGGAEWGTFQFIPCKGVV